MLCFCLLSFVLFFFFFFFQAEDGIRDLYVTGVQTCALPICRVHVAPRGGRIRRRRRRRAGADADDPAADDDERDRKSTRLNSSHVEISYAVFCLKKKKKKSVASSMQKKKQQITKK